MSGWLNGKEIAENAKRFNGTPGGVVSRVGEETCAGIFFRVRANGLRRMMDCGHDQGLVKEQQLHSSGCTAEGL